MDGLFAGGAVEHLETGGVVIEIEIHGEVGVRIDEAGEEGGIAEIDDFGAGGDAAADGLNVAVGDDDEARGDDLVALAVEHAGGFDGGDGLGGKGEGREEEDEERSHRRLRIAY